MNVPRGARPSQYRGRLFMFGTRYLSYAFLTFPDFEQAWSLRSHSSEDCLHVAGVLPEELQSEYLTPLRRALSNGSISFKPLVAEAWIPELEYGKIIRSNPAPSTSVWRVPTVRAMYTRAWRMLAMPGA